MSYRMLSHLTRACKSKLQTSKCCPLKPLIFHERRKQKAETKNRVVKKLPFPVFDSENWQLSQGVESDSSGVVSSISYVTS